MTVQEMAARQEQDYQRIKKYLASLKDFVNDLEKRIEQLERLNNIEVRQ